MSQKNLGILKIQNEEKVLRGEYVADLIFIDEGSLTIYGSITANYYVTVNNGTLIVTKALLCGGDLICFNADVSMRTCETRDIKAENTSIYSAQTIWCNNVDAIDTNIATADMEGDDIIMPGGQLEVFGNLEIERIEAEDVIVHGDIMGGLDATCFNYLIDGENNMRWVDAINIYVLGKSRSEVLGANDIFLGSDADFRKGYIRANHHFEAAGTVENCSEFIGEAFSE